MSHLRIHRLSISNYRGVAVFDQPIPERGVIIKGANSRGKTSLLRAIQAALAGQDVGPDAIRLDEKRAEILVDLGHVNVQRVITENGSSLRVRNAEGDTKAKPVTYLAELLGTSPLDPLELILEKDKAKRRARVLAALPTRVTQAHLDQWLEGTDPKPSAEMLAHALTMHGLDAVAMLRKHFYDHRAGLNAELKGAHGRCEHLQADLSKQRVALGDSPVETVQAAVVRHSEALQKVAGVKAQGERAKAADARAEATRQQIAKLRAHGEEYDRQANAALPPVQVAEQVEAELREATGNLESAEATLENAKAALKNAQAAYDAARSKCDGLEVATKRAQQLHGDAADKRKTAQSLEDALAATTEPAPSPEDLADAEAKERAAFERIELAERQEKAGATANALEAARTTARHLEQTTGKLTTIVDRLTHDAPSQLLGESKGIEGLSVEDDDVLLDGVKLSALSGAEQMRFCVDIARRANAKARILICDQTERLDPDQMEAFVEMATEDGWQLICTRVDRGDVVVEHIEVSKKTSEPE